MDSRAGRSIPRRRGGDVLRATVCSARMPKLPLAALVLVAATSCGAPPSASNLGVGEVPAESSEGAMHVELEFYGWNRARPVILDEDDAVRTVAMGRRFEVDDREVRTARSVLVGDVLSVHQVAAGWVFLMGDGSLWRAPSFLDDVERVGGPLNVAFRLAGASERIALVVTTPDGQRMLTSDGTGPFAPLPSLADVATGARFFDAERGVVRFVGGALALTADGGRTFRRIPLDLPASRMFHRGDEVVVELGRTDDRARVFGTLVAIRRDGSVAPLGAPPAWVLDEVRSRDRSAHEQRFERLSRWLEQREPPPRRVWSEGLEPGTRPAGLPPECFALRAWPEGQLALCRTSPPGSGHRLRYSADRAGPYVEVPGVAVDGDAEDVDPTGRFVVMRGSCAGAPGAGDSDAMCVIDVRARRGREVSVRSGEAIVAMHEGAMLLAVNGDLSYAAPRMLDATGREVTLPIAPEDTTSISVSEGLLSIAGRVDGRLRAFVGPVGASLAPVELPDGARVFAMADAVHGVAAGDSPSSVRVTRDGGRSFEPVPIPIAGDLPRRPRRHEEGREDVGRTARCTPGRCAIRLRSYGFEVSVRGFGDAVVAQTAVATGTAAPDAPTPTTRSTLVGTECALDGPPEANRRECAWDPPAELTGALGDVQVTMKRGGRVGWSGRAGGRRWDATARPSAALPASTELRVAYADPDVAIFALCHPTCTLVRARRGEVPDVVAADLGNVMSTAIGSANEREILAGVYSPPSLVHAYWFDRAGTLTASRAFTGLPFVAERDGQLVFLERWGAKAYAMGREASIEPSVFGTLEGPISPCSDASPVTQTIHALGAGSTSSTCYFTDLDWRVTLRPGADGRLCAARMEGAGTVPAVLEPRGERLEGPFTVPSGARRMSCRAALR